MKKKVLTQVNAIYHLNREVWKDDKKYTLASLSCMVNGVYNSDSCMAGLVDETGAYAEHDLATAGIESRKEAKAFNFKDKKKSE